MKSSQSFISSSTVQAGCHQTERQESGESVILSGIASRQKKSGHLLFLPRTRGDKWLSFIGEISHSPLISPCLRAPLLRNQTTKEQLHEKLLSAITTFTFLLIFLLSSILAVDRADTGWRGLPHNLLRLTVGRYYCAMLCVEEEE